MTQRNSVAHRVGQPLPFKPKNDRRVNSSAVPCPVCQAPVGERCHTLTGTSTTVHHPARRRMAIRQGL